MKILVISVAGIGNTLLFEPAARIIRKQFPDSKFDLLAGATGTKVILDNSKIFDNIHVINKQITKGFFRNLKICMKLFFNRYDVSILAFPSNRWQFNLLSFLFLAKKRVGFSYPDKKLSKLTFLNNKLIPMKDKLHDIDQNLRLLDVLIPKSKISKLKPEEKLMEVKIKKEDKKFAKEYLKKHKLKRKIIGMHPGCSIDQPWRRWSPKYFGLLADKIKKELKHDVLIVLGPDEVDLGKEIKKYADVHLIKNLNLMQTSAVMAECNYFISNDSGPMHIASALKVPTLAIFGPSDFIRMAPFKSQQNVVKLGLSCSPCTHSLHNLGDDFECSRKKYLNKHNAYECMDRITPDIVFERLKKNMNKYRLKTI